MILTRRVIHREIDEMTRHSWKGNNYNSSPHASLTTGGDMEAP